MLRKPCGGPLLFSGWSLCLAYALLAAAGCGGHPSSVQGVVRLDGELLPDGNIVFQGAERPIAVGKISDGGYAVAIGGQYGLLPGEYIVTVSRFQAVDSSGEHMPVLLTPPIYNRPESSPLKATIEVGVNHLNFNLSSIGG